MNRDCCIIRKTLEVSSFLVATANKLPNFEAKSINISLFWTVSVECQQLCNSLESIVRDKFDLQPNQTLYPLDNLKNLSFDLQMSHL